MSSNAEQGKVTLYDWRPFFRGVAQKLYEIGQRADTRDQRMREVAAKIFGTDHKIVKEYPKVDPFSVIYTLSRTPHNMAKTFLRLINAHGALLLDEDIDPQRITDFDYPHPPRLTLFHSNGSYVETNPPKPPISTDQDEQKALNGLWELFNTIYKATDYTKMRDDVFLAALQRPNFGLANLTQVMFLINPDVFLPIDDRMLWLPLFPEVERRLTPKQLAQVIMKYQIEAKKETFSGIMEKITGAFPGCKPYEINLGAVPFK